MQKWLFPTLLCLWAVVPTPVAQGSLSHHALYARTSLATNSSSLTGIAAICPNLASKSCGDASDCICETETWYNYTCSAGQCAIVLSAGQFCTHHAECASYPILGDTACSAECSVDATCQPSYVGMVETTKCCLGADLSTNCTVSADKQNPCATGLVCGNTSSKDKTQYRCESYGTQSEWFIGAIIAIFSAIFVNLGLNLQKLGFRLEEMKPEANRRPVYLLPYWILGFGVWVAGNIGSFIALNYAAQSLVAPIGAVSLLCNAVVAPLMNKEPFGVKDLIAIVLIAGGTIITVIFSSHQSIELGICELMALYRKTGTIVYIIFIGFLLLVVYSSIRIIEANLVELPPTVSSSGDDIVAAKTRTGRKSRIRSKVKECWACNWLGCGLRVSRDGFAASTILPFCYAALGGLFAATTILFAKSSIELIRTSLRAGEENQFLHPHTYIIVLLLLVTILLQVYWISAGLSRYEALVQIPVFHVAFTLFGVISAGVYFDEFRNMSAKEIGCFILGVLLTFGGVVALGFRTKAIINGPAKNPNQDLEGKDAEDIYQMFDPANPPQDPNPVEKVHDS